MGLFIKVINEKAFRNKEKLKRKVEENILLSMIINVENENNLERVWKIKN